MSVWNAIAQVLQRAQSGFDALITLVTRPHTETQEGERGLASIGQEVAFTIALIGLGAKLAKADGMVTGDEVAAFRDIVHIPEGEERNVQRVFDLARQDVAGFEGHARKIAQLFAGRFAVLEDLLDGLFHIALADGEVDPSEQAFLARVAEIFGFSDDEFERIRCANVGCPDASPYDVLGVAASASDDEIRVVHRRLVRENHPDALVGRGVPAEFAAMAAGRLAKINAAYDRIKSQRSARA